ncbi:hypothetical protein XENOCAPTIV_013541, partial [Xenoophorus captivus]
YNCFICLSFVDFKSQTTKKDLSKPDTQLTGWARSCSKLLPLSLLTPSRGRARSYPISFWQTITLRHNTSGRSRLGQQKAQNDPVFSSVSVIIFQIEQNFAKLRLLLTTWFVLIGAVSGSCSCLDQDTTDNLGQCLLWTNSPAGSLQLTGTRLPFANPVHPPAEFPLPSSRWPGPLQARHVLSLVDILLPISKLTVPAVSFYPRV